MKSADYWKKRSEEIAGSQFKQTDEYIAKLRREYDRAIQSVQRDIEIFYARFAANNEISMAEARKLLTGKELKEFKMTLEDFIDKAKNNADGRWTQQLNNVYFKTRVSRLEALRIQIRQQVEMLTARELKDTGDLLNSVYKDTYYRTIFEIQKGAEIGVSFAKADAEKVLSVKWVGGNYSRRIWSNRDKLVSELETKLSQSLIRGDSIDRTAKDLAERMNVSYSNAARVVRTESSYITNQATGDGYKASGVVQEYEYLATLDSRTSELCQGMDGHIFTLNEKEVGLNFPPLHPNCRSTVVPHFDDEDDPGERIARGEDKKVYYVPGELTYERWKKQYVDSTKPPENVIINPNIFKRFNTPEEANEWEKLVTPQWLENLTVQEANAITEYTDSLYSYTNKYLRAGEIGNKDLEETIEAISSGLAKFNLGENIIAYRGLGKYIFDRPLEQLKGSIFTDQAFTSTSLLENGSFTGPVQIQIRIPAGSKGAYINSLSEYRDDEYEFLLDKGTQYEIIDAKEENGKIFITMDVI